MNCKHGSMTLVVVFSCLAGCVPHYKSASEMPQDLQADLETVENHYLQEAGKSAAFAASCDEGSTKASVLSTSRVEFMIKAPGMKNGAFLLGDQISTIGVDACGTKLTYKVLCGPQEEYAAVVFKNSKNYEGTSPCKVVAETMAAQVAAQDEKKDKALVIKEVSMKQGCPEENIEVLDVDQNIYRVNACGGIHVYKRVGKQLFPMAGGTN